MHLTLLTLLPSLFLLLGCNAESPTDDSTPLPEPIPEKRCGESRDTYFSAYAIGDLEEYADCTILVGHFQEDSVTQLQDLAALKNVRKVEGTINIFRSPGFITLHGLENLEIVDGSLFIHLNPNLQSIKALKKLRTITGNLHIEQNDLVPPSDLEWIDSRLDVGGTKYIE